MNRKAQRLLTSFGHLPSGSTVVEIGCVRVAEEVPTDGFSTFYLAQAAAERGWVFHSVDIDPNAVRAARKVTRGLPVKVHRARGVDWLAKFDEPINGLYLDGAADPQQAVDQFRNAKLAQGAVIVIDDVQPIASSPRGKGDLLIDTLKDVGFRVRVYKTEPGFLMAVATTPKRRL